ncbi:MAG TPA: TetR/AcrR family transcriptional regulator [Solirubrobacterales bacterium]|nr:TetR/AcrR family transcriptional regulator [Solirubrobacterales bacterium]
MSTGTDKMEQPRRRMTAAARRQVIADAAAVLFSERGYRGASIEEIARASGVTPPVVYEHFDSKRELYRGLLERHFAELREVWREHFAGAAPLERRVADSFDAWFAYVEIHPFAGRVLFRYSTDPEIEAVHAEVAAQSREAILPLFAAEPGAENVAGSVADEGIEMVWVVLRGVLQGLAVWWSEHPEVPRERIVATAMNSLWVGFERAQAGEMWGGADGAEPDP